MPEIRQDIIEIDIGSTILTACVTGSGDEFYARKLGREGSDIIQCVNGYEMKAGG